MISRAPVISRSSEFPLLIGCPLKFKKITVINLDQFHFRWLNNSVIEIRNAASNPLIFNLLKWKSSKGWIWEILLFISLSAVVLNRRASTNILYVTYTSIYKQKQTRTRSLRNTNFKKFQEKFFTEKLNTFFLFWSMATWFWFYLVGLNRFWSVQTSSEWNWDWVLVTQLILNFWATFYLTQKWPVLGLGMVIFWVTWLSQY